MASEQRFQRGLSKQAIQFLNEEYQRPDSLWRSILDDRRLLIAIRNGYLNAYRHGRSFVLLRPKVRKAMLEGHTSPMFLAKKEQSYFTSSNGKLDKGQSLGLYNDLIDDRSSIFANIANSAGPEGKGITALIQRNPNIIDVEIAMPGSRPVLRIDLALVKEITGGHEIVFYEAKTVFDSRVRCDGNRMPEVVTQINSYEDMLRRRGEEVLDSYRTVIDNFLSLEGVPNRRRAALKGVDTNRLSINPHPRLVFVGYDQAQKDWWVNTASYSKLIEAFGKDRVLLAKTL